MTVNGRVMQDITRSFAMQYELTYQFDDVNPNGYTNNGTWIGKSVVGNIGKFTVAPTLYLDQ